MLVDFYMVVKDFFQAKRAYFKNEGYFLNIQKGVMDQDILYQGL